MSSEEEDRYLPEVTTSPVRRTCYRAGPSCCCSVLDTLFAEAIHAPTTRKHDTQIALQVVTRNAESNAVLTGDKGYDDQKLRRLARDHDIRPLIRHREFTPLHKAWNARLDSGLYYQRNMNKTVNAAIKQKFGAFVRSRLWWKQFRELVIKCVVHNLERSLAISHEEGDCP